MVLAAPAAIIVKGPVVAVERSIRKLVSSLELSVHCKIIELLVGVTKSPVGPAGGAVFGKVVVVLIGVVVVVVLVVVGVVDVCVTVPPTTLE